MAEKERAEALRRFMACELPGAEGLDVLVATVGWLGLGSGLELGLGLGNPNPNSNPNPDQVAFGMGIDNPRVRIVVRHCPRPNP